ncbi:hypothetical protein RchiOBHm_Chr5g0065091 [Rosa chinensis]|uniref:Uncharacterized protein n=1 Tax=Rosa chinensis TaxID=74649 RepID=A0A2P6QIU7_ROSCH|nr:hypothetical protein RchiOBHm_Chr5g0065091 [Rosa chinensis]
MLSLIQWDWAVWKLMLSFSNIVACLVVRMLQQGESYAQTLVQQSNLLNHEQYKENQKHTLNLTYKVEYV